MKNYLVADVVGLIVLTFLILILTSFIPRGVIPRSVWPFIYVAWSAFSMFVWKGVKKNLTFTQWIYIAGGSLIATCLWIGGSGLIARLYFNNIPLASKGFDLLVACIISPGLTFAAIAGAVREVVQRRQTANAL